MELLDWALNQIFWVAGSMAMMGVLWVILQAFLLASRFGFWYQQRREERGQ